MTVSPLIEEGTVYRGRSAVPGPHSRPVATRRPGPTAAHPVPLAAPCPASRVLWSHSGSGVRQSSGFRSTALWPLASFNFSGPHLFPDL